MFVGHLNNAVGPGGGTRPQAHGGHYIGVPGQYRVGHRCIVDNDASSHRQATGSILPTHGVRRRVSDLIHRIIWTSCLFGPDRGLVMCRVSASRNVVVLACSPAVEVGDSLVVEPHFIQNRPIPARLELRDGQWTNGPHRRGV